MVPHKDCLRLLEQRLEGNLHPLSAPKILRESISMGN